MNWIELSVTVNQAAESIATEILQEAGSNGVAIEDSSEISKIRRSFWRNFELNPADYPEQHMIVKAYFNDLQYDETLKNNIFSKLQASPLIDPDVLMIEQKFVQESDWENEWKNYFHPFQASERFFIVPSWESVERDDTQLYIELDQVWPLVLEIIQRQVCVSKRLSRLSNQSTVSLMSARVQVF